MGLKAVGCEGALPCLGSHTIQASVHLLGRAAFAIAPVWRARCRSGATAVAANFQAAAGAMPGGTALPTLVSRSCSSTSSTVKISGS